MSSRSYFDSVASEWDSLRAGFFSERVREVALDALGVEPERRAADIGAGTGFMTEALIERGASVIAVDESPEMLNVLQEKLGDAVDYRLSRDQRLPLDNASVDYVVANMYLHHVQAPSEAIGEMIRVLRPGGSLAITDLDSHTFEFLRDEHRDHWLGFARDDMRSWLEQAGATNVEIQPVGTTCEATSASGAARASIGIFVALGRRPA